jgi:CRISPR/Cas system CSM-associated protein Csm3 (group 7 of RAMP superfamily)
MTITAGPPSAKARGRAQDARAVTFIRFFLRFAEPGAVTVPGSPDPNDEAPWDRDRAHLVLDADPQGRPQLPGTSLAGCLREMVRLADGEETAKELFGCLLPAGSGGTEVDAKASQIRILGSRPVGADGDEITTVPSVVRASTAICRTRGAAKANTLRVEELLPAGSRFEIFLRWDDARQAGLERLLSLLAAWHPLLGRGSSRGRGRCVIEGIYHGKLRLNEPEGLHCWLTASGPALARTVATTEFSDGNLPAGPEPLLQVTITIAGPLRVGTGQPAEAVGDQGQKVAQLFREGGRYILPGTGLKGLLRSRAEFILRSVRVTPAPCMDQRCGKCWPCTVFGHGGGQDPDAVAVGARALVRIPDAPVADPVQVRRQHVAIDRFTGGAHEGLLYTDDVLEGGSFTITVERLADDLGAGSETQIRAVLRLVLNDLHDGIAGIGAGVARGYGSVTVDFADAEARGYLPSARAAQASLAQMAAASTDREVAR